MELELAEVLFADQLEPQRLHDLRERLGVGPQHEPIAGPESLPAPGIEDRALVPDQPDDLGLRLP
jgi:hypothetical protein